MKPLQQNKSMGSPLNWLDELNRKIKSTKCRIHQKASSFTDGLAKATTLLKTAIDDKTTVFWVGNGGSSAICSHLAQDVLNKLEIKSLYFGDTSLMTCMANDFGYKEVYARPLKSFVKKNDILIAISSSGNSDNILSSVKLAKDKGLNIISLSGMKEDNKLFNSSCDVSFFVPSNLYGIVETSHEAILHGVIEALWLQKTSKTKKIH